MVSVSEAKAIIKQQVLDCRKLSVPLHQAVDNVLAQDVHAFTDIPAFAQSAMDGYAFAFDGWVSEGNLMVVDEIPAGRRESYPIAHAEAARIFTGAALPVGADTVVMQEAVEIRGERLHIVNGQLEKGSNVRLKGAEIRKGELAARLGERVSPAMVGFLSAIGIAEVTVFASPSVAIVVTGDELQTPGNVLLHGQVYEASSSMLQAALYQMGIKEVSNYHAVDSLQAVEDTLRAALASSDVVLITGGVSVGDYDFVVPAALGCGVEQLFHRVRQRPGKPLFFGKKGRQPVFGLPGNPSSVLTCFYEYVWPVLRKWAGMEEELHTAFVPLSKDYNKTNTLTHFLKGCYRNGEVDILGGQESFRLRSFAVANCLVKLGEEMRLYKAGELVEVDILPAYG